MLNKGGRKASGERVAAIRSLPEEALEQLVERYGLRLLGLAAAQMSDRATAEEMVQDVLYAAYRLLRRGQSVNWAWLARGVVLRCRSERRRAWWRHVILTGGDARPTAAAPDPAAGDLLEHVRALPPPQRDAILLHYWAGFDLNEVARLLRVPVGTVKSRLHRARRALAHDLEDGKETAP